VGWYIAHENPFLGVGLAVSVVFCINGLRKQSSGVPILTMMEE